MARHVHEDTLMVKQVLTAAGILVLSWAAFAQGIVTPYISTPPNLPAGFAGTSYSQTLIAGPPSSSFTLSLTAGSLPAGLSLSSAGVISGVPTASGTSIFVVSVSTPILGTGSETFTLTIFPGSPHLVITPAALPSADPADYGYLLNLAVGGGPPPYAWALTSGALPGGFSFCQYATGAIPTATTWICGSSTASAATSTFTVTVTDATSVTASQTFTLAATPITVDPFTTYILPAGAVGAPYSQGLTAIGTAGGAAPYSWYLSLGALPAGLSMSSAGAITGTPTTAGGAVFRATVTDANSATASGTFTLSIAPFAITTPSPLPAGVAGVSYSQMLAVSGGRPPYVWSAASGALPAGLTLSTGGLVSGVPITYGSSAFSVVVTDAGGLTASQSFSLTINPAPLTIATVSSLPYGIAGAAYSQTLTAAGGVPPYVWQLNAGGIFNSGVLPPLLTLGSNGVIAGVPTTPGEWAFNITVTDAALHTASQTFSLTITLGPLAISTPATLPAAVAGAAYSQTLAATGGAPPYTWQVASGTWPAGLSMSSAGVIAGTPAVAGTYTFSVQVNDGASETAARSFSLTVIGAGSLSRQGVISQVVAGGGWTTTIWLVNRTSAPVQTSLVFHGDTGSPLSLPLTVTQPASSQQVTESTVNETIAPNTTLVVATGTPAVNVEGWADVLGNGPLSGIAVFSNGTTEAAVPLQSQIGTSISLPFDNTNGASTGVALVNLASVPASITATVWDQYGNQVAALPVTLTQNDANGGGHDSFMLPARLAVTAGIRGIVQFQGNPGSPFTPGGQLTGLGLRAEANGLFTSIQTIVP
jgi:hypothetical protein